MRAVLLLAVAMAWGPVPQARAQSSCGFGVDSSNGGCSCPAGFNSPDNKNCALPACGGSLYQPGPSAANLSSCACSSGWTGPACTVCQTGDACVSAIDKYVNSTTQLGLPGVNSTMVCSTSPRVYSAGSMSCKVIQSMLQGLFPGNSVLSITRVANASLTPGGENTFKSAGISASSGTAFATLYLNNSQQFSCSASGCSTAPSADGTGTDWTCPDLKCLCHPGAAFCGGGTKLQDLTAPINSLAGPLTISCQDDGSTCNFKQQFLKLFGQNGLPLSDCTFGECVNQYVIDQALGIKPPSSGSSGLSGGVIAGLAVVGAILLAIAAVAIWGVITRNKARKAGGVGTLERKGGVGLSWKDIGYEVQARKQNIFSVAMAWLRGFGAPGTRPGSPQSENGTRTGPNGGMLVLDGACGQLPPGGFCCVLGPSGSGKSTLCDILSGRRKAGIVEGKVAYLSDSADYNVKTAYCDQSDVLCPVDTVLETLRFAAHLRLPENVPDSVKEERVRSIITQLGLDHIAHSRVGSGEHRGISGGEMRRVSIGVALAGCPDILVLDEPTSGLDSVSAARIVTLLKNLAESGTTIIASIHQPSSALYQSFSQVLLLSNGRQLYFGPGGKAPAEFFAAQGRDLPPGYNIADYLLEIASDNPTGLRSGHDAIVPARKPSRGSDDEKPNSESEKNGTVPTLTRGRGMSVGQEVDLAALAVHDKHAGWFPRSHCATTFLSQFIELSKREWRTLKRDKTLFWVHFGMACIVGVFAGGLYFKVDLTIAGFQNRVGSLFFLGTLIAFSSLSALNNLVEQRPLFLRERAGQFYSPQAWLLSRAVFDIIPLRIIPNIVLSIIVYFMVALGLSASRFFRYLLILVEYTLVMVFYNFLLASIFPHASVAMLMSSLFTLFCLTFAGYFVNIMKIPAAMRWLHWLDPLYYTLEALTAIAIKGLQIEDNLSGVPISVSAEVIQATLFNFDMHAYYRNVLVLFGFIAGFGLAVIFCVIWLLRERR